MSGRAGDDGGPDGRTLVLDLGGVLVDWDPRYLMAGLIADPAELEWFLAHVANEEWLGPVDRGEPFADAVARRGAEFPRWSTELAAYAERWPEMVRGALPGTAEVIRELHAAGVRLVALSNWPADTFWVARERFDVLGLFSDVVVSGFVGLAKPDPAIYRLMLERSGLDAGNCVFVDDRPVNVAAAEDLGLTGIRFTDAVALRAHPAVASLLAGAATMRRS